MAFTVKQLLARIKGTLESTTELKNFEVTGELSGVKHHSSGHWYFDLKDGDASLRSVMWQSDAARLAWPPADGQAVRIQGRIGVWEKTGVPQLYARSITLIGEGAYLAALAALKRQLDAEGFFHRPKRPIPTLPRAVGVITAETGAARYDIESVIGKRFPGMPVILVPAIVQGAQAPASLLQALHTMRDHPVDVVILGRGGGSREDQVAFNDEALVRAVAQCPWPIISAVGHQIDHALLDDAADYTVETPTAAAVLAVPEAAQLVHDHIQRQHHLALAYRQGIQRRNDYFAQLQTRPILHSPTALIQPYQDRLNHLLERWDRATERAMTQRTQALALLQQRLRAVDLLHILTLGYAYVTATTDPQTIVTAASVHPAQSYVIHWHDGTARAALSPEEVV